MPGFLARALTRAFRKRWHVYGDLTPFPDRWHGHHIRLLCSARTWTGAWIAGQRWILSHPHGSAFISGRAIPEDELDPPAPEWFRKTAGNGHP